ncbi:Uncharacterised protein [Mycobacteroides abscessus subsp. abscessus]|nr:Uncharacterised protein [Mycobacteroides abscessus subsp. abscessus]
MGVNPVDGAKLIFIQMMVNFDQHRSLIKMITGNAFAIRSINHNDECTSVSFGGHLLLWSDPR